MNKKVEKHTSKQPAPIQKFLSFVSNIYAKIRFILRLIIITIIATIISIAIVINNTNPNKYKETITRSIEKTLNKKVEIHGNLQWKLLSFEPGIEIEKLSIANEKWSTNKHIITAENIIATISLKNLLNKEISLDTLLFDTPKIYLEISKSGQKNWRPAKKRNTQTKVKTNTKTQTNKLTQNLPDNDFEVDIKTIKINNAEIYYDNKQTNTKEKLTLNQLFITSDDYNSPILFNISISYKDKIYSGNFKTSSIHELWDNPNVLPLTGILNLNGINVKFSGKINKVLDDNKSGSATIYIDAPNLQESLRDFATLPPMSPIYGDIELIATPTFFSIKKLNMNYMSSTINGNIEISLKNKKPDIKANLHIPFFDIPNLFYPNWESAYFERLATGKPRPKKTPKHIENPKAFRNIPLPVKELDIANLNLKLTIDKLKAMPEMTLNNININAILNNGQGVISPISFNYMGGRVRTDIIANNNNNTFNGDLSIKAKDVNLGQIIDSTGYKKFFSGGDTNVDIVLKGFGKNLETFMQHINGYIKAYTTSKTIGYRVENTLLATDLITSIFKFIGDDIIGTITLQGKQKPQQSEIQCAVINLNIKNGQATSNRSIAMQTKSANIIIDGTTNLSDEYMDISIITVIKEGFQVSNSLTEMIKIQGPMAAPNIIINKEGVINNVAKTAFTTALVGVLTGGITLITTGIGLLTKSWLNNITEDNNPCLTAFKGKASGQPTEDFTNQTVIKETTEQNIKTQKEQLENETTTQINEEKQKIKANN